MSYAISHKEPTRNDYQDNYVTHLKAEKLQDWELGYHYDSKTFTAGVNLYYMYYNHQYVLTGAINEIGEMIASNDNSGKSYREGIELEVSPGSLVSSSAGMPTQPGHTASTRIGL